MTADRINRWLTLGASVGVLIGIVLLVLELNQGRDMMRAQTRNELAQGVNEFLSLTISDAGLSDIVIRANRGEALMPTEAYRLNSRSELAFRYWENVHYQYRQGLYDETEFSRHRDTMVAVLARNPSLIGYWCRDRLLFSVPFMEFIDGLLEGSSCQSQSSRG